jgi:3-phenylpropionate/trans-cinnamate dioxygenase ferredoxin reductase subunit
MSHIVVVGAGQAGSARVAKLRALGHAGPVTLIGDEPVPPYQRPPLSKKYLLGEMTADRLFLRPESFYADQGITLRLGSAVTAVDPVARVVQLADGPMPYDRLALCTGSVPRRLPAAIGGALAGVHVIRSIADIDALAPAIRPGQRAVIVGGGYIGLEAAAVAAQRGLSVTVIEAAPRILARVAAPETSDAVRALHQARGVTIRESTALARLTGEHGHVTGAELADGPTLDADLVILGIGIAPDTRLAENAGLMVDDGIVVNARARTSDPAIWAAGDCARLPLGDRMLRLESVQNAIDQAETAAADMLGVGTDYAPVPWFWSDQYDMKLQIAGLGAGADRIVIRATPGSDPWKGRSHWYYAGDRLIAVDALSDPRAYMIGKRLLESGRNLDPALAADPTADLKAVLG